MARLRRRQARVRLLHARHRLVEGRVAVRVAARQGAHLADPHLHALVRRRLLAQQLGRRTEPLDRHHLLHPVGIGAGVLQRDRAAERVADDGDLLDAERAQQLVDVERVVDHRVAAADRPLRVAVAAQVGRDDVEVAPQILRDPVPVARVVAAAVDQQQRRLLRVAPVDVVQLAGAASRSSGRSGRAAQSCGRHSARRGGARPVRAVERVRASDCPAHEHG